VKPSYRAALALAGLLELKQAAEAGALRLERFTDHDAGGLFPGSTPWLNEQGYLVELITSIQAELRMVYAEELGGSANELQAGGLWRQQEAKRQLQIAAFTVEPAASDALH